MIDEKNKYYKAHKKEINSKKAKLKREPYNLDGEIWREHPIYTDYEGSSLGRIRCKPRIKYSFWRGKTIEREMEGYICIQNKAFNYLAVEINRKRVFSHKFICECFHGLPNENQEVDHINTIKTDNRPENLRWVTRKENMGNTQTKINMHKSQINNVYKSKKVLQLTIEGELIKEWPSTMEIHRVLGYKNTSISACCLHRPYYHTAYGFKWEYA